MTVTESIWKEYYKNLENQSLDQSLVSFGEEMSLNDGTLGAMPFSPQQYKARAERWLRLCMKELCPYTHQKNEFKNYLEPTNKDFVVGALIGFGEHLETILKNGGHTGVLLDIGIVYTSVMVFKYGITELCNLYCDR